MQHFSFLEVREERGYEQNIVTKLGRKYKAKKNIIFVYCILIQFMLTCFLRKSSKKKEHKVEKQRPPNYLFFKCLKQLAAFCFYRGCREEEREGEGEGEEKGEKERKRDM